jgi:hypothetical protein
MEHFVEEKITFIYLNNFDSFCLSWLMHLYH